MKKFFVLFLILVSSLCFSLGISACGGDDHEHAFGDWLTQAATCQSDGKRTRTCSICGTEETEILPKDANAHIWNPEASESHNDGTHTLVCKLDPSHIITENCAYVDHVIKPTCLEAGETTHTCLYCDYSFKDNIQEKLDHDYADPIPDPENPGKHIQICRNDPSHKIYNDCEYSENVILPSCETKGYTQHTCDYCGHTYLDNETDSIGHDYGTKYEEIPDTHTHLRRCLHNPEHILIEECSFSDNVIMPDCENSGYTEHTCTKCDNTYRDNEKEPIGHSYGDWQHSQSTSEGESKHYRVCNNDPEHIEEKACNFANTVVEADCTRGGSTTRRCIDCSYEYISETTDRLDHIWSNFSSDGKGNHVKSCMRSGCEEKISVPCEYNETEHPATCLADGYKEKICKEPDCHYTVIENHDGTKLEHLWEGENVTYRYIDDDVHEILCGRGCGEKITKTCEKTESETIEPTCTAQGYTAYKCRYCENETRDKFTDEIAHTYGKWEQAKDYGDNMRKHTRACTVCHGAVQTENCTLFHDETTDATCWKDGFTNSICDACGGTVTTIKEKTNNHTLSTYIEQGAQGHYRKCDTEGCEYVEEITVHNMKKTSDLPTCTDVDKNISVCEDCGYVADGDDIPALGHNYSEANYVYDSQKDQHYRECKTCHYKDYADCVSDPVTTDATCFKDSYITYNCNFCHNVKTVTLEHTALGCDYSYVCEADGEHKKTCLHENCDNPKGKTITEACNYIDKATPATCTDDAFVSHQCKFCQNIVIEVEKDSKKGHRYGSEYKNENNGTHTRNCLTCGYTLKENCEFDAGEIKTPTCTESGYIEKSCNHCGYTKQEINASPTGHKWNSNYSSDNHGHHYITCSVCNFINEETRANCDYLTVETKVTCTTEGYTSYTCKTCTYHYESEHKPPLSHSYKVKGPSTEKKHGRSHILICENCSAETTELCSDSLIETAATCTSPTHHKHVCQKCNGVYEHDEGSALGHRWDNCTPDPQYRLHTYTCSRCGNSKNEPCVGTKIKEYKATCSLGGWTEYLCTKCNKKYKDNATPALGHQYGTWQTSIRGDYHYRSCKNCIDVEKQDCVFDVTYNAPTCTQDGSKLETCKFCQRLRRETLQKLGHDFGEEWISDQNGKHYHECRHNGCSVRETFACTMVPGEVAENICQAPEVGITICKFCAYTKTPLSGPVEHNWSEWTPSGDGNHYKYCLRIGCNARKSEPCVIEKTYTQLSCTTPESEISRCSLCHDENITITQAATGHSWYKDSVDDTHHHVHCLKCATVLNAEHDFEDSNLCGICDYDGLTYELNPDKASYKVANANKVKGAEHIKIAERVNGFPVTVLDKYLFMNNKNVRDIELPRTIETISDGAFEYATSLQSFVLYGSGDFKLTYIGIYAFYSDDKLPSFPFEEANSLETISAYAFGACASLDNVQVPDTLHRIGTYAFDNTKMYKDWLNGGEDALYLNKHLIKLNPSFDGEFEIKADTITVGASAFENCKALTKITIHNKIKMIDNDAFKGCDGLKALEFKGSLDDWLSITFGNNYSSPMQFVSDFHIAESTDNPSFPSTSKAIPAGTFRNNPSLITVTIPDNITSIGANAFEGCVNLTTIHIPDSVIEIGADAFKGCTALENNREHWDNGIMYLDHHLIKAVNGELSENIVIRENTVTISPNAFRNCTTIKSVKIPKSVMRIGDKAFDGCVNLEEAYFDGATDDEETGTIFFAQHSSDAMGRWLGKHLYDPKEAAMNLRYFYTGYWKRVS